MELARSPSPASAQSRGSRDEYSVNTDEFRVDVSTVSPENIAVCIRVRPLTEREERQNDASVLRSVPRLQLISITDARGAPLPGKTNAFQYDHIFDAPSSTADIYARVARRIVRSTLEGINGTIFAYGQTSSGKTYTMQGPLAASERAHQALDLSASPGLLQLAVDDIFQYIEQSEDRDFLLRVSFVEIYNEVVRDLLAPADKDAPAAAAALKLREDPRRGVYVECKEEIITDFESILHLLHAGNQRRAVGQTAMNDRSSRSHSIFRIVVESKRKSSAARKSESASATASASASSTRRTSDEDVNGAVLVASLSFVDLAGSESLRHTAAEGIRQREASNINKSLLTLSRVINSLASAGEPAGQSAPFRDSKLTRLLQNSLGGNTRTLIVCCVTPAERYIEETKSTLQFAARAKSIKTSATVNEVLDDQAQLRRLKRQVHELKKLVHVERDQYMAEIDDHKVKIDHLKGLILSSASIASRAAAADKQMLLDGRPRARSKRSRETWCPGDFPSSIKARRLDGSDGSPLSLRRLSADSRRSRLSSDMDDWQLPGSARSSLQSDAVGQAHRLWVQLLTQSLRHPDADETAKLWENAANASGVENTDAVVKLQSELSLITRARQSSTEAQEQPGSSTNEAEMTFEELKRSLTDERERHQALIEEKEQAEEAMATERDDLMQHLHTLQSTVAEKESRWEAEKQQLQSSLEEVLAEANEFRSRTSRMAGSDAASSVQELAKAKRQVKKAQMELARAREEQQRREELHREALADVEAASKGSVEEYAQQLEDAFAEIETLKMLKTQVAEQLEAAFDDKAAELTSQLEDSRKATQALEHELAALKQDETSVRSSAFEEVLAEKQALMDAKAGLEEQLERMATRQSRLEQQIKTLDGDNSELQENVEELQCRVDALLKENRHLQERPAEVSAATGLEDVSGELKEVLNELVQLRATIDSTEREKEDLADQNERLAGELGDAKTLLVEKEHQVKVLHAQLDAKVMTISQLSDNRSAEVAALKQEAERLQMQQQDGSEVAGAEEQASRLKDELLALKEHNAQLEQSLAAVVHASQQAAAAMEEESEADVLPTQVEVAESDEDRQLASGGEAKREMAALVDTLRGQLLDVKLPDGVVSKEVAALLERDEQSAEQSAEAVLLALQRVLMALAAQHSEMLDELRALEAQLMIESQEKMALAVAADEQRVKLLEAEDKAREAEEKLALVQSLPDAPSPVGVDDELRQQLETLVLARRRLELDVASYEETLALLRRELTNSSLATAELAETLRSKQSELEAAGRRQQSAEKEIQRLATALERSSEERAEMQQQMKQRLVAAERRELALEERLELLTHNGESEGIAAITAAADASKEAVEALEQQLMDARDALATRERELQLTHDELQELRERLDQAETDERALHEQVGGLEARLQEQEAAFAAKQADETRAMQEQQQARDRAQQAALEVDGLREQLLEAQEELERYQKYADDEIHRLRSNSSDAELAELAALRQAAARSLEELEELREARRAAELEARECRGKLAETQLALERVEQRSQTQRARIDKLEKVKMTNETLEVFRKLKADRKALQEAVGRLQRQLQDAKRGGGREAPRGSEAEAERELRDALRAERQRLREEREKSASEVEAMRELLRAKVAAAEELALHVEQLEHAYVSLQQQQSEGTASELERKNLELQFEVRRLQGRLAVHQQADSGVGAADKENAEPVGGEADKRMETPAVRHPALLPSVRDLRRQVDDKERDSGSKCIQQ